MPGCNKENPPYPDTPRLTLVRTPAPITTEAPRGQWSMLMARAQDGDRDAYRSLLTEVEPYVRSIAFRYLNSSSDLEDAVQDVLRAARANQVQVRSSGGLPGLLADGPFRSHPHPAQFRRRAGELARFPRACEPQLVDGRSDERAGVSNQRRLANANAAPQQHDARIQ